MSVRQVYEKYMRLRAAGYEYASIHEILNDLSSALSMRERVAMAKKAEKAEKLPKNGEGQK